MPAHIAEEDGIARVDLIAGKAGHISPDTVPSVTYTHPKFASAGKTGASETCQHPVL